MNIGKGCSGLSNSGDCNSGNRNSGNWNSGDWNSTNYSNGCFNTEESKIYMFNKLSDWTYRDWFNSDVRWWMSHINCDILEWVYFDKMTDEEKKAHSEAETTGGYLKELDNSESGQIWWRKLNEEQKHAVMALPNFDKEIFKQITGIDVEDDKQ